MSSTKSVSLPPPSARVLQAILLPVFLAFIINNFVSGLLSVVLPNAALVLAALGLVSWFIGWRWYGLKGLGLRGGRPFYAGAGFAVLGWLAALILRVLVAGEIAQLAEGGAGRQYLYLVIFEAFCIHLWVFGLFFRSAADWRGGLTAAISSGVLFGTAAFLFYGESYLAQLNGFMFFCAWGVFYGVIRLRTGSLWGLVLIQPLQSLTVWFLLQPLATPDPNYLGNYYLALSLFYIIMIWRLWPKEEGDYRV